MESEFLANNLQSLQRLQHMAERITIEQLETPLNDGWSVASVLAHLAFWDFRA